MKSYLSLSIFAALKLVTGLIAAPALAAPVFRNAATEVGFRLTAGVVRILPDSTEPDEYYLLPLSLSASLKPMLGPLPLPRLDSPLFKVYSDSQTTQYSFLLVPNIGLLEALAFYGELCEVRRDRSSFDLKALECRTKSLDLDGVPQPLMTAVRSEPVSFQLDGLGLHLDLPEGFAQRVVITAATKTAVALENAILELGVRGTLTLECNGYAERADTLRAPTTIEVAIPVDARFEEVSTPP